MTQPEISELNPAEATDDELRQCHEVLRVTHIADYLSRPAPPYTSWLQSLRAPSLLAGQRRLWVARGDGQIIATATIDFPQGENSRLTSTMVRVPPRLRRQGIGTTLLRATLPGTRAGGRDTVTGIPKAGGDGEKWAIGMGFAKVHENIMQSLVVADVDPGRWDVPVPAGFRAERWVGIAPESLVAGYARARTAIADAPRGGSSLKFPEWTVQRVRRHEAEVRDRGWEPRTVVAVHEASGTVAGITEMGLRPDREDSGQQMDTAVLAEYRGHGLGRFLKAEMMRWLRADRPQLKQVTTNTAADNVHMIRVNHQLGYVTVDGISVVEADVETLDRNRRHRG
jgi:GNAT superfamily N-acetyltransferase